MNITQVKENLTGMFHGGTLNKIRNQEAMFERAANNLLTKISPEETMRTVALSQTIHDDLFDYALPSDYKRIIDLYPQSQRTNFDQGKRILAERFSLQKALANRTLSIEGAEGSKVLKVDWHVRQAKTLHAMNAYNDNGTWTAVGSATGVATDNIYRYSGNGSVRFDLVASGDGIQNTTMSAVDLTDEDENATVIFAVYLPSITGLTSITPVWGNNLTTAYWTGVAQTAQADGTAFRVGWNIIKCPWSTATETGTVDPATIDSFKITFVATSAISDIRVDNILFGIGYPFDIKYYSKYIFKNSAGTWLSRPTSDDDTVVLDSDGINIFLYECLLAGAQQMEGEDSSFDISFATKMLYGDPGAMDASGRAGLYRLYKAEHPEQSKKAKTSYGSGPRFQR